MRFFRYFIIFSVPLFLMVSSLQANCPECDGQEFVQTREGDEACTQCGCVQAERVIAEGDLGEKTDFSPTQSTLGRNSKSRVSGVYDVNQTTAITSVRGNKDNSRLRETQKFMGDDKHTNNINIMKQDIEAICTTLHINQANFLTQAFEMAKNIEYSRGTHVRTGGNAMAAAIVYYVCKINNTSKGFKEISQATNIEERKIVLEYKSITKKIKNDEISEISARPVSDCDPLPARIEAIFRILFPKDPTKIMDYCREAKLVSEKYAHVLEGRQPQTIAAACVAYTVKNERKSLHNEIAEAAKITSNTLRTAVKQLEAHITSQDS